MTDRLPPHDNNAEKELLGSLIRYPDALAETIGRLKPEQFYVYGHGKVFAALVEMQNAGKEISLVTLATQLAAEIEEIGGYGYLDELWSSAPCAPTHLINAEVTRNEATKRDLIQFCTNLAERSFTPGEPVSEILADFESRFNEIVESGSRSETKHASQAILAAYAAIDERRGRRDIFNGTPSGFSDLDALTAGFKAGELVIVAARPSVGKTAWAGNLTCNAVRESIPTLFISLEQSSTELAERLLCGLGIVDSHRMKTGRMRAEEAERMLVAGEVISRSQLFIDDTPGLTLLQICANARRMKRLNQIGLVIIDYLQLIVPDGKKDNRQEQVAGISRRLKLLARELKIPVIVLAQLNRETEKRGDGRPRLSDLRESGAIEQDADLVILLHRPVDDRGNSDGLIEAIVGKHRNGPTGSANLVYAKQNMRFESLTMQRPA